MKIALFMLDFLTWAQARPCSYVYNCGVEDSLAQNGAQCFTIPTIANLGVDSELSWLSHARRMLRPGMFDQVWVWLVHPPYTSEFLQWLETLAPVRVGFLMESLHYSPEVTAADETLRQRSEVVLGLLQSFTHCLCVDEADPKFIEANSSVRALWWPCAVPSQLILPPRAEAEIQRTAFFGSLYGKREQMMHAAGMRELLVNPAAPEDATSLPRQFETATGSMLTLLQHAVPKDAFFIAQHAQQLRLIRTHIFTKWLEAIRKYAALLNPQSLASTYTSRVVEAMAAGTVAVAWRIPDRPLTAKLFEDGKAILLYPGGDLAALTEVLQEATSNHTLSQRLTRAAREVLLAHHTTEIRGRQVLDWLESGKLPPYCSLD